MYYLNNIRSTIDDFKQDPIQASQFFISSMLKPGFNLLNDEWDLAIILDTCRPDALSEVSSEYAFIDNISTRYSIGSATPEWLANTFTTDQAAECAEIGYIAGNPYVEAVFENRVSPLHDTYNWNMPDTYHPAYPDDFAFIDYVCYPDIEWGGHPPASYVTNQTIYRHRNSKVDRLIAHYIQPHAPYIGHARESNHDHLSEFERRPFKYLRRTDNINRVWDAYLTELKCGLDEVEVLLNNVHADNVVITADHGEAFGEWNAYKHRSGMLHHKVRKVPHMNTTATDNQTRHPEPIETDSVDQSIKQQLETLGYRN